MRSLRILQVAYKSEIYGGERVLLDLTRGLTKRGHRLYVACPSHGPLTDVLRAEGIHHFVFPMKKTYDLVGMYRLYKILRRHGIDVVQSHGVLVNILSRIAAFFAGTPVSISTAHIPLNLKSGRQAQNVLEKMLIPYYLILDNVTSLLNYRIIAVSHAVKRDLVEQGVSGERVVVVQNGIDPILTGEEARYAWGRSGDRDDAIVGTITRLSPQKDLDTFLLMAKSVVERVPGVKFIVVGDGEQRERLESSADNLGLHEHVTFLGYRKDARELLRTFDVFVLSSLWEGLPIVVLEAMAAEKPIVATAVDGVTEVVEHGRTGFLVEPRKPGALAECVVDLINNPGRARKMGQRGRQRLERFFSAEKVINTVEQLYLYGMLNRSPGVVGCLKIYLKKFYSTWLYISRRRLSEWKEGVSVLFYHSLGSEKGLSNFLRQIEFLEENGYQVFGLSEVLSYVRGEKALPPKSVSLTFDDGYCDTYKSVFPVLADHGMPATIFLSSKYISSSRNGNEVNLDLWERFLSWEEVIEMASRGVHFGSHGYHHWDLTRLPKREAYREILRSKHVVEGNIAGMIRYFSYPYGKYDDTSRGLVKRAGFEAAFTTTPGTIRPGDDSYTLKRILIAPSDSLFDFKKKISGVFV
jgi:glycosyltransferase involved in cell wall biosynthesis/peptidoglycan/xylan/chitin deacetylase (PgdA/CDA1 family)